MTTKYKSLFLLTIITLVLLFFNFSTPVCAITEEGTNLKNAKQCTGDDPANELCNPISVGSPQKLIGKIIVAVLGIVGSLALLMFIYGGFTWMTAAGNQESITKGKNILVWATIGLIIIFSSYAIVRFVFEGVGANVQ